jgi:hypothetical protein
LESRRFVREKQELFDYILKQYIKAFWKNSDMGPLELLAGGMYQHLPNMISQGYCEIPPGYGLVVTTHLPLPNRTFGVQSSNHSRVVFIHRTAEGTMIYIVLESEQTDGNNIFASVVDPLSVVSFGKSLIFPFGDQFLVPAQTVTSFALMFAHLAVCHNKQPKKYDLLNNNCNSAAFNVLDHLREQEIYGFCRGVSLKNLVTRMVGVGAIGWGDTSSCPDFSLTKADNQKILGVYERGLSEVIKHIQGILPPVDRSGLTEERAMPLPLNITTGLVLYLKNKGWDEMAQEILDHQAKLTVGNIQGDVENIANKIKDKITRNITDLFNL